MKVNPSTAAVLIAFIVGWVVLAALGKPIPAWMAGAGVFVAHAIGSLMPALLAPASSSRNGDTPPETPAAKKGQSGFAVLPLLAALGLVAALLAIVVVLTACGAGKPTAVEEIQVGDMNASQLACVNLGKTGADIDGCRAAVRRYWCGDGGALAGIGACAVTAEGGLR